jgi:hypothetical protein
MAQTVTPTSAGVDAAAAAKSSTVQPSHAKAPPVDPNEPDFGLVIQKNDDTGRYVYTVLDRATGRVITQIPSADVLSLMNGNEYAAGKVFRTKA